jgi:hypothetical protein
MHQEAVGNYDDKKQAILLHLQMILLKVRRAGRINGQEKEPLSPTSGTSNFGVHP